VRRSDHASDPTPGPAGVNLSSQPTSLLNAGDPRAGEIFGGGSNCAATTTPATSRLPVALSDSGAVAGVSNEPVSAPVVA
jgi:hypothetical protein